MVAELFKIALVTSLAGGVLTLILAIAHPFTMRRFSAGWNYYIWLAVVFVMLCPIRISLPERAKTAVVTPRQAVTQIVTPSDNTAAAEADVQTAPVRTSAVRTLRAIAVDKFDLLAYIWLIAAAALFAVKIVSYAAFLCRVKVSSRELELPEIARYTNRRVRVRRSGSIISPLIVGVFRPVLLLPKTELNDEQLRYVLMHEATHLNRGDILYKWLVAVVKCVHWFNPTVYFMAAHVNTECEISCDAAVTSGMTRSEKIAYVKTILALLSSGKRPVPLTTGMTGGKRILRKRFEMIRNKSDIGKRTRIVSAVLALIMTASASLAGGVLADEVSKRNVTIEITSNGEKVGVMEDDIGYVTGRLGMITEDVKLRDAYQVTIDEQNNYAAMKLDNVDFFLHKNDMVIVLDENEKDCRVMQAFGDIPVLRGTIDKNLINYDKSIFKIAANQAIANNVMGYDNINGNEIGLQVGAGIVQKREADWVLLSIPMREKDFWFKSDDLSYDFDTEVMDMITMPVDHIETAPVLTDAEVFWGKGA